MLVGMILAAGCRRQPERTPDAHFSSGGGLMPVTFGETPSKDLLQPAASPAVVTAEEPEAANPEAESAEEEEGAEEEVEEVADAAPATPTRSNNRSNRNDEYDPTDPVNSTIGPTPGILHRGR
jgi:hypothetical protein